MTDEFEELENLLRQLVSVVMVPEDDYPRIYKSALRYVGMRTSHRRTVEGQYDLRLACGAFLKLVQVYWPDWPPQDHKLARSAVAAGQAPPDDPDYLLSPGSGGGAK